jgi:nucleoside-diphosphate-sugar epimerase
MKTLITGATGFIGERLAQLLTEEGEKVVALCRPQADVNLLQAYGVEIRRGDIVHDDTLGDKFDGIDRIYHLAAYARNWARRPETFLKINVEGLRKVLGAALATGVKRVVFASSEVTLGPSNGSPVRENPTATVKIYNDYQQTKMLAESVADEFISQGIEVVIVNPTRVFGPGLLSEGNSVTKMIKLYLEGKWRLVLGKGDAIGNYTFVEDVVRGFRSAMQRGRIGHRYILGGENLTYNEFFRLVKTLSGKKYSLFHVPPSLALGFSHFEERRARLLGGYPLITPGWVRMFLDDWECSCEKAIRELGYKITPAENALEITIQWIMSNRNGKRV